MQLSYGVSMENKHTYQVSPIKPEDCNLAAVFDAIGDRRALLILRSVLYGVTRFDDLHAENKIPRTVLSDRLKRLCANGFLEKQKYKSDQGRSREEYCPSPMTRELVIPFIALTQWSDKWLDDRQIPPVRIFDRRDQKELRVALVNDMGEAVPTDHIVPKFT